MSFINNDFLLTSPLAHTLYEKYSATLPIVDYHCHIDPKDIALNTSFTNLSDIWLSGDHYKWRLMRAAGIAERFITGDASPKEKFIAWAGVIGKAIGNPLYHWNCLELARYFGICDPLTAENAEEIWDKTCKMMAEDPDKYTARGLIKFSNVECLCTTDDPCDTLEWHKAIAADDSFDVQVLPSFRPDPILDIEKQSFGTYIEKLSSVSGIKIESLDDLIRALDSRIDHFVSCGCRIADHGMEYIFYEKASKDEVDSIFRQKTGLTASQIAKYKTYILLHCASRYAELNITMQYHFGCIRDVNAMRLTTLGVNCGCDSISGAYNFVTPLTSILSDLSASGALPRTILYSLNPSDNTILDTMIGCFQEGPQVMKVQHGAAWWFNDNMNGMIDQMKSLACQSYFPGFLGMLTDSRSFLSYTRHEYFRRILCSFIADQVNAGLFPNDEAILGEIVTAVSYGNSKELFD